MPCSDTTYYPCTYFLTRILAHTAERPLPFARYHALMGVAVLWAVATSLLEQGFTVQTLLPAIGVAYPMLDAAYRVFRDRSGTRSGMVKVYCALLALNALHFLD